MGRERKELEREGEKVRMGEKVRYREELGKNGNK